MNRHLSTPRARIAALVVTHQRLDQLRVTVAAYLAEDVDHVVVFDNASTDGTAEWLDTLSDPRLQVLRHDRNAGGAGGFDLGLRHVMAHLDPDWCVVSDDDGRPLPGAITAFRALSTGGWDAIGAAVLAPNGHICEMNRPYRNPFWRLPEFLRTASGGGRGGFHLPDAAYRPEAGLRAIDMASFVGLFLSRAAIARAGYPDGRLFIYGDDQLYTLQMRRKGLTIGFAPAVRFEHDTRSRQTGGAVVLTPLWKVYYMYRNALIAYRVAAGPAFWPLLPLLVVKWRRIAPRYGAQSSAFRHLLRQAVADGLGKRLDRSHSEIVVMAETAARGTQIAETGSRT